MLFSNASLENIFTEQYGSKQAQPHNDPEHARIYKEEFDDINIDLLGDEFIRGNEHRSQYFGKFTS